jgi:hypothetical protein
MELQKAPLGLLGWFSLKVLGRNPPQFGEAIQPVVDVGDSYLVQSEFSAETILGTFLLGNAQSSLMTFVVPASKLYRVWGVAADTTVGAGDAALNTAYAALLSVGGNPAAPFMIAAGPMTLTGNLTRTGSLLFPRPMLLGPGTTITVFTQSSAALAGNATPHAYLLRNSIDI